MNIKEAVEKLNLNILVEGDMEREITDCYIGDLLSWVMGRAKEDSIWLTVMGNINAIAVATLAFKELTFPLSLIETVVSHFSRVRRLTPFPSLPTTIAIEPVSFDLVISSPPVSRQYTQIFSFFK